MTDSLPDGVRLVATLRGHTDAIGTVRWSPDGRLLATPSKDRTVRIWDAVTHELVRTIEGHELGVWAVAFDRYGRTLATGDEANEIKIWDVGTWTLRTVIETDASEALDFSPYRDVLAGGGFSGAQLFDPDSGVVRHHVHAASERVSGLAFHPVDDLVATAGYDHRVQISDIVSGSTIHTLSGHADQALCVSFAPDGRLLASGSRDSTVKVWDPYAGTLLATLEGHVEQVRGVAFHADGRLLASKSRDGTVLLWDCTTWASVALLPEPGKSQWLPGIAFHPSLPLLASPGSEPGGEDDSLLHLWELDIDRLLDQEQSSDDVRYTSAKIVLVGESGVGKTGLGHRLAHGEFTEHPSTHGQQFWLLDQLAVTRADGTQCEAVLWDLAGQPDYRLVHALFLDDADLALILFDPARDDDPLRGVDFWLRQLTGRTVVLVSARTDRGTARLTEDEIRRFCAERGIHRHVLTSALTGAGLSELLDGMRTAIDWDVHPTTVTTDTFKWVKDTVLGLKEGDARGRVIVTADGLREYLASHDPDRRFSEPEMLGAAGHLANHGYVAMLRTSTGETRILLTPELLNNVAASIVLEARRNPRGLGALEEQRVLDGGYPFGELTGLAPDEQDVLLDSAVALFLRHNVCFRETDPLSSRVYLVFPALINLQRPFKEDEEPVEDGVAYTVTGAVQNVYASLVVLLGYTDVFARTDQWRCQAEYAVGNGLRCGFRLDDEHEDELHFVLYYGTAVGGPIRMLFQGLFESFLAHRTLTVRRLRPVRCAQGHVLHRAVVQEHLTQGNPTAFCSRCGDRLDISGADEPVAFTRPESAHLAVQRGVAADRSRFEQVLFQLSTYVTARPTCFVSYAWGEPRHERWVEQDLATDLKKAGVDVILDRWENSRIGASVPRFVDRAASADFIVVVGTPLYRQKYANAGGSGFVVAAEGDIVGDRMVRDERSKETVLPVLLEGSPETSLPPLLRGRVGADFRRPERYFPTAFDLIATVHRLASDDPVVAELRHGLEPG